MDYRFHAHTEVAFTRTPAALLGARVAGRRVGIISTPTVLRLPECQALLAAAQQSASRVDLLGLARPNPIVEDADQCREAATAVQSDTIVAIGGGSAMDAAKAVRAALATASTVGELFASGVVPSRTEADDHKLIVIPSAFGTGAETSAGAILTRRSDGKKGGIRGPLVPADLAIASTELVARLPSGRCVEIGFDALTHAIETYLSRAASPLTDVLALDALDRLPSLLVSLADSPSRPDLLAELARYSFQLGFNLANASTCLPHRMQYAVAMFASASHQLDLAALYPAWLRALERHAIDRLPRAMRGLRAAMSNEGISLRGSGDADVLFDAFLIRIGVTARLTTLGLHLSDASTLAARTTGNIDLDPLRPTPVLIEQIFADALTT